MDFDLTEDQRAFQATARSFARDEMMPHARDWDEGEIFPVEALRKAAELGFGGIYVKDDVGGSALTRLDSTLIFEELAQGYQGPLKIAVGGPWTLAASIERPRGDRLLADYGARRDVGQSLAEGIKTTIPLHKAIMSDPVFIEGKATTAYMEDFMNRTPPDLFS